MNRLTNASKPVVMAIVLSVFGATSVFAVDKVSFRGSIPAKLIRKNGSTLNGDLLVLNSQQVFFRINGARNTTKFYARDVARVETANDTYTFDLTSKTFQSRLKTETIARQAEERERQAALDAEERERQAALDAEAKKRGPVKLQNDTDYEAIVVLKSYKDEKGGTPQIDLMFAVKPHTTMDVRWHLAPILTDFVNAGVAELPPGSESAATAEGSPLVTSYLQYTVQVLHSRTEHTATNATPGMPFVLHITKDAVPALLPLRVGKWNIAQSVSRRKVLISTDIGAGRTLSEEQTIVSYGRRATATANIENVTDRAVEATITLEFDFGMDENYGNRVVREFTTTRTIEAHEKVDVSITGDCGTLVSAFSLSDEGNLEVERVAVRNISYRAR